MKTAAILTALCYSLTASAVQTCALCQYVLSNPELPAEVCRYLDAYAQSHSVIVTENSIAGYSVYGYYSLYLNIKQSQANQHGLNQFSENVRFHERYQPAIQVGSQVTRVDRHQQIGSLLESRSFTDFINDIGRSRRSSEEITEIFQINTSLYLRSAQSLGHLYTVTLPGQIEEPLFDEITLEPSNGLGRLVQHLASNFIARITPATFLSSQSPPTQSEKLRWRNQHSAISTILEDMPVSLFSLFSLSYLYESSVTRIYRCPGAPHLASTPVALICPYWRPSNNIDEWRADKHRDNKKYLRRRVRDRINPKPDGRSLLRGGLEALSF